MAHLQAAAAAHAWIPRVKCTTSNGDAEPHRRPTASRHMEERTDAFRVAFRPRETASAFADGFARVLKESAGIREPLAAPALRQHWKSTRVVRKRPHVIDRCTLKQPRDANMQTFGQSLTLPCRGLTERRAKSQGT